MKNCFLIIALLVSISCLSQEISGKWSGKIAAGKGETVFVFTITKDGNLYKTLIDVPSQRRSGLAPKQTSFEKGELLVDASNIGFIYKASYNADSMKLFGSFIEGVNSYSLNLGRETVPVAQNELRPQEPVRPYPYREESVVFQNKAAGVNLAGTLTIPPGKGKYPVVVLISGSGPQDRDETFSGHKPFLVLADYLTRQGIAVLRYDDRGIGQSTGDHSAGTTKNFAEDVIAAVDFLRMRNDIDPTKIGLIGHSEGGIIAPLVVNMSKNIAFIVLLAGTGIPGSELIWTQIKSARSFPVPDEAAFEHAIRKSIEIASMNKDLADVKKELREHYFSTLVPMLRPMFGSDSVVNVVISRMIEARTSPWMRYFYTYNPAVELQKNSCPIFSLNGNRDTQVDCKINQNAIRLALSKGVSRDYTVREYPGLNHLFQECTTGAQSEYSQISQTISPKVLTDISEWILAKVKK